MRVFRYCFKDITSLLRRLIVLLFASSLDHILQRMVHMATEINVHVENTRRFLKELFSKYVCVARWKWEIYDINSYCSLTHLLLLCRVRNPFSKVQFSGELLNFLFVFPQNFVIFPSTPYGV